MSKFGRVDADVIDVAIVGCGPVGSALAILLRQLGSSVVVLERQPQPYPLPRAVHFDDKVGRILQMCGIGEELRAITEPAEIYEWRNATAPCCSASAGMGTDRRDGRRRRCSTSRSSSASFSTARAG